MSPTSAPSTSGSGLGTPDELIDWNSTPICDDPSWKFLPSAVLAGSAHAGSDDELVSVLSEATGLQLSRGRWALVDRLGSVTPFLVDRRPLGADQSAILVGDIEKGVVGWCRKGDPAHDPILIPDPHCGVDVFSDGPKVYWYALTGTGGTLLRNGTEIAEIPTSERPSPEAAVHLGPMIERLEEYVSEGSDIPWDRVMWRREGVVADAQIAVGEVAAYELVVRSAGSDSSRTVDCGSVTRTLPPDPGCSWSIVANSVEVLIESDASEVILHRDNNGQTIAEHLGAPQSRWDWGNRWRFTDAGVPLDEISHYEAIPLSGSSDLSAMSCGSFDPAALEPTDLLLLAKETASGTPWFPHQYVTLTTICPQGCGERLDLVVLPDPDCSLCQRVFFRTDDLSRVGDNPSLVFPQVIHDVLLDAINAGREVQFELNLPTGLISSGTLDPSRALISSWTVDPSRGLISSWTIDGVGADFSCIDRAVGLPPDETPGRVCNPDYNLLRGP